MRFLDTPLGQVYSCLCMEVDTPRSLACYLLARNDDLLGISALETDPRSYDDSESYFRDLVCIEFLRKLDTGDESEKARLDAEAWSRFEKTELQCAATNARMSRFLNNGPFHPEDLRLLDFIERVRKNIHYVVGNLPGNLDCAFGPGSTISNRARFATVPHKLSSAPSATPSALYIHNLLNDGDGWCRARGLVNREAPTIVRGGKFFTVPKDSRKRRGACMSASANLYLQLGIGRHLRERLKRVGIRINGANPTPDQHHSMARQGSLDGSFATIDLSDASNTVSRRLIELLWPSNWFELLNDTRERMVKRPDGRWQYLEMLSAMGNGFTFEVETITFWAIARACCPDGEVSTFGDDIIVPTTYSKDVIAALQWCGFSLNTEKTFTDGHFRESCGGDFFRGTPTRCYYVKEIPSEPPSWISIANGIRRMAFGHPDTEHRWSYLRRAWRAAIGNIPNHIQSLRGPVALGDLVVHDPAATPKKVKDGIMYWLCLVPQSRHLPLGKWSSEVQMSAALYGVSSRGPSPRGAPIGYRKRLIPWTY